MWFSKPTPLKNPIPPSESAILSELNQLASQQIGHFLELYLNEADHRLLIMAEVAASNEQQNRLFEIKSQLRQHGDNIKALTTSFLQAKITNILQPQQVESPLANAQIHEYMELIDLETFEDWLSLETIVRRAEERYYKPIACLEGRYSKLLQQDIQKDQLPVSIANICQALQEALRHSQISPSLLPVIYRIFDETVIRHLGDLYDTLNAKLKSYGVLPNIESEILRDRRSPPAQPTPQTQQHQKKPEQESVESSISNVIPLPSKTGLFGKRPYIHVLANLIPTH